MLLNESEGDFSFEEWEKVAEMAKGVCCGNGDEVDEEDGEGSEGGVRLDGMDVDMDAVGKEGAENLWKWLRSVVRRKVEWEQRWKEAN